MDEQDWRPVATAPERELVQVAVRSAGEPRCWVCAALWFGLYRGWEGLDFLAADERSPPGDRERSPNLVIAWKPLSDPPDQPV